VNGGSIRVALAMSVSMLAVAAACGASSGSVKAVSADTWKPRCMTAIGPFVRSVEGFDRDVSAGLQYGTFDVDVQGVNGYYDIFFRAARDEKCRAVFRLLDGALVRWGKADQQWLAVGQGRAGATMAPVRHDLAVAHRLVADAEALLAGPRFT
jgi:hypothetical protein